MPQQVWRLYWVRVSDLFPEAVCHRSPGACSGLSLSFASLWKGAWEGNACRKSAGTVRDGCLYLSVERRVVKTVCRLFCRGFGKMARVYELLLLRRSLDAIGEVRLFGDDARSDQLIAIVPGCELSRRDSALRFVEKQVGRVRTDEEFRSLQRLAITDTDIETTAFARFQFPERVDPVQLAGSDPQGPAVKSRMVVPSPT